MIIMPYEYNKKLAVYSRELRKNMTPEEKHLWFDFLKKLPITVNRQKMIGEYIVDFYIHSSRLVIEIDGIQHSTRENKTLDEKRDSFMNKLGIVVLRYPNSLIRENFAFVCEDILNKLGLTINDIERF